MKIQVTLVYRWVISRLSIELPCIELYFNCFLIKQEDLSFHWKISYMRQPVTCNLNRETCAYILFLLKIDQYFWIKNCTCLIQLVLKIPLKYLNLSFDTIHIKFLPINSLIKILLYGTNIFPDFLCMSKNNIRNVMFVFSIARCTSIINWMERWTILQFPI